MPPCPSRFHFVLSGSLTTHLADTNEVAQERMDMLMGQMAQTQGITEQLKSTDQMAWVRAMNNIQSAAREIVLSELIYI
ncbi:MULTISPECIES: TnpV protein [Anaerostipes]|uniref:TnpV protein n=1 Tax=Anaerostipes TaxID=207244 RepID=UPI000952F977|nr:TnpV protein [Anaerostipes faecalis]